MNSCSSFCGYLCLQNSSQSLSDDVGSDTVSDMISANVGSCRACPWGWGVRQNLEKSCSNSASGHFECAPICQECSGTLDAYDWVFILFNVGILLTIHLQAILRFSGNFIHQ